MNNCTIPCLEIHNFIYSCTLIKRCGLTALGAHRIQQ